MISSTDPRLQRLLGGDRYALLRKRLRQRFERAPLDATVENFRIGKLTAEEHAALASLLGRPLRYANSLQVDVRLVDTAFQMDLDSNADPYNVWLDQVSLTAN